MDSVYLVIAVIGAIGFFVSGITSIIQAFGALSSGSVQSHHQKWLYFTIIAFFIVSVVFGGTTYLTSHSPSPTTSSTSATLTPTIGSFSSTPNSSTPTTTQTSSLINIPLSIEQPSGQKLSVMLYFGQLGVLLQNHPDVGFSTDSNYVQQHGQLCVETVVVSSIFGNTAVVYSQGLPTSWGAAEGTPQSDITQTNYIAHQQLIVPPASIGPGTAYVGSAQVVIDQNIKAVTETYHLTLKTITNSQTQWNVQSNGTDFGIVECNAGPN